MDKDELEEQIDIILEDEIHNHKSKINAKNYYLKQETESWLTSSRTYEELIGLKISTGGIVENPEDYTVKYPNLELLFKLYDRISHSSELRDIFSECMGKYLENENALFLLSEFAIKMKEFDEIQPMINPLYILKLNPIFKTFDDLLTYEYQIFSNEQLKTLRESLKIIKNFKNYPKDKLVIINKILNKVDILLQRIHNIRYKGLAKYLHEGTDFQIKMDRDKIKEKINTFGFDPILSEALDKIEDMYWDTTKDDFDNSMALDKLRTFWEKLIDSFSDKIREKTRVPLPTSETTKIANQRLYIKNHLKLDKEHALMNKLVDIINHRGSHNFISEREYFRLTKNITIEIAYLLFIKLGKFLE